MYEEFLKRKEKVIITSIDLLDEAGIQGLTTKELAKREGITEPVIYKQFTGKQSIILAIIDKYAEFDDVITNTILEQSMSPKNAVFYFAEAFTNYYQSYPQITTVMFSFDVFRYDGESNEKIVKIMNKRYDFLTALIEKGQKSGEFKTDINPSRMAEIILGTIWSFTYRWKLNNSKSELRDNVIEALNWILK